MIPPTSIPNVKTLTLLFIVFVFVRCIVLVGSKYKQRRESSCIDVTSCTGTAQKKRSNEENEGSFKMHQVKAMIVLGSGGHSTEMFHLLEELDPKVYTPIVYVAANSDTSSITRLKRFIDDARESSDAMRRDRWNERYPIENETYCDKQNSLLTYYKITKSDISKVNVHRLPRPREVHQSFISSTLSTLYSFFCTIQMLFMEQPDMILANGPGLCVPLMYTAFVSHVLGFPMLAQLFSFFSTKPRATGHCRMIYVESLCRVNTISLSGKLLYPIVDRFVVHWPNLKKKYSLADVCDVFVCQRDVNLCATMKKECSKDESLRELLFSNKYDMIDSAKPGSTSSD